MSKPRFTPEQHHETGRQLGGMYSDLLAALSDVENAYPLTGRAASNLRLALDRVDKARCALDDEFAREHPADFTPRAYYPNSSA